MKQLNRVKDLTGMRFGRLVVLGIDDKGTRKTYWICQCDCGNVKSVRSDSLQNGSIRSCGCLHKEIAAKQANAIHKHKQSGTRLYKIWQGMKGRCNRPNDARYARYGGRGIKVCDEWLHDFSAFYEWAQANGYKEDLTIDRIDNDGNYEPRNCRWVGVKEQSRNRSTNIDVRIGNSTRTITEWCEIFNVDFKTVIARYHRNPNIGIDDLFN